MQRTNGQTNAGKVKIGHILHMQIMAMNIYNCQWIKDEKAASENIFDFVFSPLAQQRQAVTLTTWLSWQERPVNWLNGKT